MNKEKLRASAQRLLQRGQIDKAIEEYQRLLEADPRDLRTRLKIGDLQIRNGQAAEAVATYRQVAQFYSEQGFFLKAVAVYKQILKLDGSLVDVIESLAKVYHHLGLLQDATTQYRQMSRVYETRGETDRSVEALRKLLELDPDNIAAHVKLAEIFVVQDKPDRARQHFMHAASVLKTQQRGDDYLRVAERMLQLDPSDLKTAHDVARLTLDKGDHRLALTKIERCLQQAPRDAETMTLLVEALLGLQQEQKAVSVLRELLDVQRNLTDAEAATATARRILQLSPQDVKAVAYLRSIGDAPELQRPVSETPTQPDHMIKVVVNAEPKVVDPSNIGKLLAEADIYIKYGLAMKALEHLQRVLALQPDHAEALRRQATLLQSPANVSSASEGYLKLAHQHRASGDLPAASQAAEAVLRIDPSHREAATLRDELALQATSPSVRAPVENAGSALSVAPTGASVAAPLEMMKTQVMQVVRPAAFAAAPRESTKTQMMSIVRPAAPADTPRRITSKDDLLALFGRGHGGTFAKTPPPVVVEPATPLSPAPVPSVELPDGSIAELELDVPEVAEVAAPDLEEARFFVEQGLHDDARDLLVRLRGEFGNHPQIEALLAALPQHNPAAAQVVVVESALGTAGPQPGEPDGPVSAEEVLEAFKRRVAVEVPAADHGTHYELGIAYREMGLYEDAMHEFALAEPSPVRQVDALTMMGLCSLAQGDTTSALRYFLRGLRSPYLSADGAVALRYEIARTYEDMGRHGEALRFYEKAQAMRGGFRDVEGRLAALRAAAPSTTAQSTELDQLLDDTVGDQAARKRVSYL